MLKIFLAVSVVVQKSFENPSRREQKLVLHFILRRQLRKLDINGG